MRTAAYHAVVVVLVFATSAWAEEQKWGHLRGRFLYDGAPPKPVPIKVDRDVEVFKEPILDESVIVNQENRGLANVVVYLNFQKDQIVLVHPSYGESDAGTIELKQSGGRLDPHITLLRTTQTLVIANKDPVGHSAIMAPRKDAAWSRILPLAGDSKHKFEKAELLPFKVGCNIHPWEGGYVLVQDHPYMAVTDADGKFEIKNLPAGKLTFRIWQEQAGFIANVDHEGRAKIWKKGRVDLTIKPGDNDHGEIKLRPELFERRSSAD